ncbi:twin-arginine translocation signal domain-containing protein [Brucella intermedia]|uniref:twin-arginine translocation signal domain-containing protein n=1 Tax=Brucella intermedia TaxID=94625 RepID=UPI0023602FA8|nr:twin-arginine translocation signal domain-containing protein [Brucella intermedia]
MNRRHFLSFLGLAPVAAAVPAMALPRAEKPTEIVPVDEIHTNMKMSYDDGTEFIFPVNMPKDQYDRIMANAISHPLAG